MSITVTPPGGAVAVADRRPEEGAGGEVAEVVAAGVEAKRKASISSAIQRVLGFARRLVVAEDGDRGGCEHRGARMGTRGASGP